MPGSQPAGRGRPRAGAVAAAPGWTDLRHRSLLDHPPGFRPFRDTDLFARIGGQPIVDRLVDVLYDGLDEDEQLRPLFPRDLADGRAMQKVFFAEWLGGPRRYSEEAYAGLKHRHDSLPISPALAGRWLGHFRRAMEASIAAESDRRAISAAVRSLALALVNTEAATAGQAAEDATHAVSWKARGRRILKQAADLARRGNTAELAAALTDAPDLLRPAYAAVLMQSAVVAGRTDVVRLLIDRGAGVDHPFYLPVDVAGAAFERVLFVTPLCAARMKRRAAVEDLLLAEGAREDVFASAYLGDASSVGRVLAADPSLAMAPDPAVDVLDITPLEHAVAGGHVEVVRVILEHSPSGFVPGVRALRGAAGSGNVAIVELLLAHGADATRIGTGRWVLHPELAPLLAAHGAVIDSSGSWIGASCTGNQRRRDDPDYVRALLRHGARANDRRSGEPGRSSGVHALDATALHYATKAGFLETIELLLERGADPEARDSRGRTPLEWLDEAAPSVSRDDIRRLLESRRR